MCEIKFLKIGDKLIKQKFKYYIVSFLYINKTPIAKQIIAITHVAAKVGTKLEELRAIIMLDIIYNKSPKVIPRKIIKTA